MRKQQPSISSLSVHSKAAVINLQLLRSIPNAIWCIHKQRSTIFSLSDPFYMGSGPFKSNGLQVSASQIHSKWDLVHSKAPVLNFQLFGFTPDGTWCVQKQRSLIFNFLDPSQMGYGAFKSAGPQFSASRIHSRWDLVHSKAPALNVQLLGSIPDAILMHAIAAVIDFQLFFSIPNGIWWIQKQRPSIFSSLDL